MTPQGQLTVLTNFLPPYRLPLMRELHSRGGLNILLSTPMESDREWPPDWQGLPVTIQRSVQWRKTWRHRHPFIEAATIHFPYDTVARLRALRPGIIISGELGARTLQAAAYCAFSRASRLIIWATVSEVTELDRGSLRTLLRKLLLRSADAVLVNGASGERYVGSLGVPAERIFRVPQTTEIDRFLDVTHMRQDSKSLRLLYSGLLIERKGLLPFLDRISAWASSHPDDEIEFSFAGHGPLRTQLGQANRPSNLRIRFLGHVPYSDLPAVYAAADIFVFPSLADEWGLAVVEAMAAGLPVLGSAYSQAVEDLVVDGESGWTFTPGDPQTIDASIALALSAPMHQRQAMGAKAREIASELTPVRMAQQIETAIHYVCSHRP